MESVYLCWKHARIIMMMMIEYFMSSQRGRALLFAIEPGSIITIEEISCSDSPVLEANTLKAFKVHGINRISHRTV